MSRDIFCCEQFEDDSFDALKPVNDIHVRGFFLMHCCVQLLVLKLSKQIYNGIMFVFELLLYHSYI